MTTNSRYALAPALRDGTTQRLPPRSSSPSPPPPLHPCRAAGRVVSSEDGVDELQEVLGGTIHHQRRRGHRAVQRAKAEAAHGHHGKARPNQNEERNVEQNKTRENKQLWMK